MYKHIYIYLYLCISPVALGPSPYLKNYPVNPAWITPKSKSAKKSFLEKNIHD